MNRRTRTLLPTTEKLKDVQKRQALYYNSDAHDLPELNEGDKLRLKPFVLGQKEWKKGVVVERLDERSYEIETADGGESQQIPDSNMLGHGRRTSKLPPEDTLTEPPQMSSCPDEPDEPSLRKESGTKSLPCSEPYKELDSGIRTQSGRLVTRPSYLKDFVA
ncbi:unnamed protein product [Pocillopora meandrina]|uniref:SH3 domain-containing protein n=1 Tax=Pocillopora meandrina TaxID=46732 RepID=A0AAU9Y3A7_9CNID|nr:unnamed protein product [Pocillopora meandrina]